MFLVDLAMCLLRIEIKPFLQGCSFTDYRKKSLLITSPSQQSPDAIISNVKHIITNILHANAKYFGCK